MNRTGPTKQGSGGRRSRRGSGGGGGGNGKRSPRNQNFDSNGPDVRVRGNAQQVLDRYLTLARDAQSAGDRVSSENYFQHAEHYFRILNTNGENQNRANDQRQQPSQPADVPFDPEAEDAAEAAEAAESGEGAQWERTNQPQPNPEATAEGEGGAEEVSTESVEPVEPVEPLDTDTLEPPSSETVIA